MLLKTIQEVKTALRISNMDDDSSLPDIAAAEETYIIPAIGEALRDELQTAYDANTLSVKQTILMAYIQKALAGFAYHDELAIRHAIITDAGVRRATTDNMPAAYQWEFDGVKTTLINKAHQALEGAMAFLETNKADFATWTGSTAYTRRTRFILKSPMDFADLYPLAHPFRTFSMLVSIIGDVEAFYVDPVIGKGFFDSLKALDTPSADEAQVISDLKKAVAHLTVKMAIEKLPVKITENGLSVLSPWYAKADSTAGVDSQLNMTLKAAERDGQAWLKKAKLYLDGKASVSVFTSFFNSSYYTAPVNYEDRPDPNANRKIFTFLR